MCVYLRDIVLKFGLHKWAVLVIKQNVKVKKERIVLLNGEMIKEVDESGYRYLGVLGVCLCVCVCRH